MKPSSFTRKTCRLCDSEAITLGLSLKPTPIGDNYLGRSEDHVEEIFNLDLYVCTDCGQVQLRDVVSPDLLYPSFPYVTSVSVGLPEHFRRFADEVVTKRQVSPNSLIVEIGSNEGPMLRAFQERGCLVLGVEPAGEIARAASNSGVPTLARYFNEELSHEILSDHGAASVVAANNVLANIDDLHDVMRGVKTLLAPDGILVMETSYWGDVVKKGLIDTIYHEHISYFSVTPLRRFFQRHGMELIAAERNSNKGGSIRLTAQKAGAKWPVESSVSEWLSFEEREGIHAPAAFEACRGLLNTLTAEIHSALDKLKEDKKSIAAYGASVGSTTMLYEFDLGSRIDYLVDDNSRKIGKRSPGLHIPCLSSGAVIERKPDCIVVLAWRYIDQILRKNPGLSESAHLLLPLPAAKFIS